MQAGLKMSKMGKYVHLYASFSCSVNIYNTKEVLCALNLNSSESSHVGSLSLYQWRTEKGGFGMYFMLFILLREEPCWFTQSLPMKSRERWFCDVFDTLATHAGLVHDIIDSNCWAQNGSTHGHVFTAFKHKFWSSHKEDKKSSGLLLFVFFLLFLLIGPIMFLWFSSPLTSVGWFISLMY